MSVWILISPLVFLNLFPWVTSESKEKHGNGRRALYLTASYWLSEDPQSWILGYSCHRYPVLVCTEDWRCVVGWCIQCFHLLLKFMNSDRASIHVQVPILCTLLFLTQSPLLSISSLPTSVSILPPTTHSPMTRKLLRVLCVSCCIWMELFAGILAPPSAIINLVQ